MWNHIRDFCRLCPQREYFQVAIVSLNPFSQAMHNEPQWLNIEEELYPSISILKQIIIENVSDQHLIEMHAQVTYNSFKREIDLTQVIYKYFFDNREAFSVKPSEHSQYEIYIHNKQADSQELMGLFPAEASFILGEQFLSLQIMHFVVKLQEKQMKEDTFLGQLNQEKFSQEKLFGQKQDFEQEQGSSDEEKAEISKPKNKSKRTVQQILKIVAEWRKLILMKKIPSNEAAEMVKMSKRSLEEYFNTIKLAEKYGFDFEHRMYEGFSCLRNFVKERHESKKHVKVEILQKFNPKNIKTNEKNSKDQYQ